MMVIMVYMVTAITNNTQEDRMEDVTIIPDGSVVLFVPLTVKGRKWLRANVHSEPWQWLGSGLAVDHRFGMDIALGIKDAGLKARVA